jgi:plasmid stability protein
MPSITIRNIPEDLMERIRALSRKERRSINSEILVLLEKALAYANKADPSADPELQVKIWEELSGRWEDSRSTEEIIDDIYSRRTPGREVEL